MAIPYISRTLLADRGRENQRLLAENDLLGLQGPIIILGDPGLGKTRLTEKLESTLGGVRTTGGTFYRNENPSRFVVPKNSVLIIDGLDEITSSSGRSAVDEVLRKLSQIGMPRFVLSCRAADWQGSADRHKIAADYGTEPTTLLLQPFSFADAVRFLKSVDETLDAEEIVSTLEARDLGELCGNPLTLTLVAELAKDRQGLPENRSDLFIRACELLVKEENPAHYNSRAAKSTLNDLLDSAGAIFAHLLLSGSLGIADRPRNDIPDGFISKSDLSEIPNVYEVEPVLKTRLFQSAGESLSIPFHRVIAEFLGARWLSNKMSSDLSARRVLQSLNVANGVPTALRGLHAWVAFFNDGVADRCIRNDPYGVLRYGEPTQLSIERARLLLKSLTLLANEDPYFRSEDWGRRAVAGLARPELKDEIVDLIKRPDRHIHLSTLVLEALQGSALTDEIVSELVGLVHDSKSAYVERYNAAEALIKSKTKIEWGDTLEYLRASNSGENKRLILDIISRDRGEHFTDAQMADAVLAYQNPSSDEEDEAHVSGMDYLLVKNLTPSRSAVVLDGIAERLMAARRPRHQPIGNELSTTMHRLAAKALDGGISPDAARLWSWLKSLNGAQGYSNHERDRVRSYLNEHELLRRDIQRIAFASDDAADAWMAIVHDLPQANAALSVSLDDTIIFVQEIGAKQTLSKADADLWASLVRCQQSTTGLPNELQGHVNVCVERHDALRKKWDELTAPPKRDWRKEHEQREERQRSKRIRLFEEQRAKFRPLIEAIKSGAQFGVLHTIANGYLNRYTDLDHDASPIGRLKDWLGDELTSAASTGFVAFLARNDLPTAQQIAETHAEGKIWNSEPIISCGILELVRTKRSLTELPKAVVEAALASWWEFNDFNSERYGKETQTQLENAVFSSSEATEEFLVTVVEPRIRAKNTHIPCLYRLSREDRFRGVAGKLAINWLRTYANAPTATQWELLETAIEQGNPSDFLTLIKDRLQDPTRLEPDVRRMWMAAAFLVDFDAHRIAVETFCDESRDNLWSLRNVVQPERSRQWRPISLEQNEIIVQKFSHHWPPESVPRSAHWGDSNAWNATEFIRSCINAIGADASKNASIILDRLVDHPSVTAYVDQLKHVRAQQRKKRRDSEFKIPSFSEVRRMLAGGLPAGIDDLKASILDTLEIVQDYILNGDTDGWEAFWIGDKPKDENTCRHRLLDQMRPRVPLQIAILPETLMPEAKRADIVAIHQGNGVPTEIKGQWHTELWDAAKVQLIEKSARDWRADGRGIYLVLWCGSVVGKKIPKHPDGLAPPTTPAQLREMLLERLSESERSKIDVVVFDISKPKTRG